MESSYLFACLYTIHLLPVGIVSIRVNTGYPARIPGIHHKRSLAPLLVRPPPRAVIGARPKAADASAGVVAAFFCVSFHLAQVPISFWCLPRLGWLLCWPDVAAWGWLYEQTKNTDGDIKKKKDSLAMT